MKSKEWLIETRKNKGITQRKLAEATGIPLYTIQNIEQGKREASQERWELIEGYLIQGKEYSDAQWLDTDSLIKSIESIEKSTVKMIYMDYTILNNMIVFTEIHANKSDCKDEYIKINVENAREVLEHQKRVFK